MRIADVPKFRAMRELLTCTSDTLVSDAARRMAGKNVGAVPVVDDSRLVGIFSERGLLTRVAAAGLNPESAALS